MTDLDRAQLKRDCSDALHAIQHDKGVDGIAALADAIRGLGPTYRSHGELMRLAVWERNDNTITWHLIHVLEKLERATGPKRRKEAAMERKKVTRRTAKKKSKTTAKTRAQAKRTKKKAPKAKPRRRTQPASTAVLSGGIYAGDPTGGHIGDKPPAQ